VAGFVVAGLAAGAAAVVVTGAVADVWA